MNYKLIIIIVISLSVCLCSCQLLKEPAAKVFSASLHTPEIDSTKSNLPLADYDLKVKDLKGNVVNMEDYRGKVIFLNFWATWCLPCVAELPSINKLHNQFKGKDIAFLLISDEDVERVQRYQHKKNYDVPFLIMDEQSYIPRMYRSNSVPTTFIINKDGQIVKASAGAEDWDDDEFVKTIEKML